MSVKDPRILKLATVDQMIAILSEKGHPFESFKAGNTITVWNKMKKGYSYKLEVDPGTNMDPEFKPYATPAEILASGAFEGKYLNDCLLEYPAEWFWNAIQADKLRPGKSDVSINIFGVDSRKSIQFWIDSGWLPNPNGPRHTGQHPELSDPLINPDERGWFQWYCRYWMGRRIPVLDKVQIKRWKAFIRHAGQIKANCSPGDIECRPRQRQGLFQWSHNPFI
jgi:hypothetical protein